jgi:hypothetical protein
MELVRRLGVPALHPPINVKTEYVLSRNVRFDIRLEDAAGTVVVLENKVAAIPDPKQLARYADELRASGRSLHTGVLSTAFDDDVRSQLQWPYVGLADLIGVVEEGGTEHPVLADYLAWAKELSGRRTALATAALGVDEARFNEAMRTPEGQWTLMRAIAASMAGFQYRATNVGGRPWTQFCFCEPETDDHDHDVLFYRIDVSSQGPYLSVRQYQKRPLPSQEAKSGRLSALRSAWIRAQETSAGRLLWRAPRDRGVQEAEISWLLFRENPASKVIEGLAEVHRAFVSGLSRNGWPIFSDEAEVSRSSQCEDT